MSEMIAQRIKIGNIEIDNSIKNIITRRKFIFFGKRRTIPFSDVSGVNVSLFKRRTDLFDTILKGWRYLGPYETVHNHWETFLELSGREHPTRLRVAVSKDLKEMVDLKDEIEKHMGKK